jgi:hypothetical protein
VNEKDISRATHDMAAKELKGAGQTVRLTVQYKPEEYNRYLPDNLRENSAGGAASSFFSCGSCSRSTKMFWCGSYQAKSISALNGFLYPVSWIRIIRV